MNRTRIAIYGAGGFGREVQSLFNQVNSIDSNTELVGFIDDYAVQIPLVSMDDVDDILIAVANPIHRKNIVTKLAHKQFQFNSLLHSDVYIENSNKLGAGCIICAGVKITVNVSIGAFSIINLNTVIGHDVVMGSYCSIMPSVNLLGGVRLGNGVFIGAGATILQGITIGDGAVIGAGSVVTKHVLSEQIVWGVPAFPKKLK